ncbi:hypothetical protein RZQ47_01370 [Klebsiella variicola subsp. variicola]|uniref:hypothetical protein n=1 Tax=Klebsiella variicola TaxID=244366 RepID=UPI00292BB9CC|nr:hypothetical protein [Klebsiella variicola]MDV1440374.1 hypothetical protein [Klebsiella variicola subsp. variicola]
MYIYNFEDLDKEAADAIHFETALYVIAKANSRSIKETATLLHRAMASFQKKHPYYGVEFELYHYQFSTGFQSSAHITQLSKNFLGKIAKNSDFLEDPNPENAGEYFFINDSGDSGSYHSFYFKLSELLRFFIENRLTIPDEFAHALPAAEKSHAFYKKLIKNEMDKFFSEDLCGDFEEDTALSAEPDVTKWSEFAGKETALMMIAGLAVALEKSGGRYIRGGRLNKSAVARAAIDAINEHGEGTEITTKALTDLLNEAISTKVAKLED